MTNNTDLEILKSMLIFSSALFEPQKIYFRFGLNKSITFENINHIKSIN